MSYDNRGWGPTRDRGGYRGGPRTSRNPSSSRAHDGSTNAPVDQRAARGPFEGYSDFWGAKKGSTGNVGKEQATTPDVSTGIWARAVAANQSSSSPTGNTGEQTRDESLLFSSAGRVVVAMPAAVDRHLQSAVPTSSTASLLLSTSNGASNSMPGPTFTGSPSSRMVVGDVPAAGAPSAQSDSIIPQASTLARRIAGRSRLHLLKGPGIEVVVGARPELPGIDASAETWCLPKALISHYSSTLKDACKRGHGDSHELRIMLSNEDPAIFELFVEWINNGTYTLEAPLPVTRQPGVNIDAQAWVLGDRLGSIQFKNYVMGRLYAQYTSAFEPRSILTADTNYAYEQSAYDSRLRKLFRNLLSVHFLDRTRTVESTIEWDDVLQKHPQLRMWVLSALRIGTHKHERMQDLEEHLEVEEAQPAPTAQMSNGNTVIPAKRNADGETVKKERMDA